MPLSLEPGFPRCAAVFAALLLGLSACGQGGGNGNGGNAPPQINRPPVATNSCVSTAATNPFVGHLPGSDPDGDELLYEVLDLPLKGTLSADSLGNYRYTPNANVRGMDRFTYRAIDPGGLTSNVGTISVLLDGKMRIMPLGDSITLGGTNGGTSESVGYRRKLFTELDKRYPGMIDFVGSLSHGLGANPPIGDPDHQGTGGQTGDELALFVEGYLDANPADVLLLHIGTNDFDTNPTAVETILDRIDQWEARNYPVTVLLARIIDDAVDDPTRNLDVETYNNNVQAMVQSRPNDRVIMVDQQRGAGLIYRVAGGDMEDDLHPTQAGYDKMADKWRAELTDPTHVGPKFIGMPSCQ